jgi:hypothetical protein
VWDPWLIISQIACLQSLYYVVLSGWILAFSALAGTSVGLDQILSDKTLRLDTAQGWLNIFGFIAAAAVW